MASGTAGEAAFEDTEPPLLQLLRHQDLSLFPPFMLDLSNQQNMATPHNQADRIVLINPVTQGTIILDHLPPLPSLVDISYPPASISSILDLPKVETVACCAICLEESGEWACEMPCQHRFHGKCIERWLRIHGSCPICRYKMPVVTDGSNIYNYYGHRNSDIWVSFSFSRRARSSDHYSISSGDDQV